MNACKSHALTFLPHRGDRHSRVGPTADFRSRSAGFSELSDGLDTPLVPRWFERAEVDTDGFELRRARLLRCTSEHISPPGDLETSKPCGGDRRLELCFQQSTGNSTSPELDIFFRTLGHLF